MFLLEKYNLLLCHKSFLSTNLTQTEVRGGSHGRERWLFWAMDEGECDIIFCSTYFFVRFRFCIVLSSLRSFPPRSFFNLCKEIFLMEGWEVLDGVRRCGPAANQATLFAGRRSLSRRVALGHPGVPV